MYLYLFIIVQGKELNRKGKFNFNHIPDCNSPRGQAQKGKRNETHCARHTLIEFDAASYSYTGGELLSEMSLTITPGAFYFITGPSGSGKTTFLKMCYGALLPNSGGLQIFGRDVRELTRDDIALIRRNIGVIHQDCQFLDHLSVTENIALPLSVSGQDRLSDNLNLKELLTWVGLKGRASALPPELSGGERQRAALARAVINSPELILADEPTGNIDWDMSQRLLQLLIELNKMGRTVLLASHDLSLIRLAKSQVQARVLRIANKRIQLAGADL